MGSIRPEMTPERIEEINKLIKDNPDWHRTKLSKELCEIWDWRGENGQIKDISCRDVLRALDAAGKITLPKTSKAKGYKKGSDKIVWMLHELAPIECPLSDLTPLTVEVVTDKYNLMEFKSYIDQYHYLGYDRNIGENIKYMVYSRDGRQLACLAFGSAAWSCEPRDSYIGWNRDNRRIALKFMTNNSRFLIFPWIRVKYLASHILSIIAKRISSDWMIKYGHPLYCLETFVEVDRFQGICYQAANWVYVGETTGKGRDCKTTIGELPIKDIYIYPLDKRFRKKLTEYGAQTQ